MNTRWLRVKAKYENNKLSLQEFVNIMKNTKVYYSTPMGKDKSGASHLYFLSRDNDKINYFPAFLSFETCEQFFTSVGRNGFLVIEGNLKSFLSTLDANALLQELGAIIEPNSANQVVISPMVRCTK